MFKGIIETDNWFGPLFTNVRIIKTDIPIDPETKRGRRCAVLPPGLFESEIREVVKRYAKALS
jgi:hypothetical protein